MVNFKLPPKKEEAKPVVAKAAKKPNEKAIESVINKGGKPTKADKIVQDKFKNFNIEILESELATINELREKRPRSRSGKKLGISLRDWFIEAIHEKIDREQKRL